MMQLVSWEIRTAHLCNLSVFKSLAKTLIVTAILFYRLMNRRPVQIFSTRNES